MEQATDKPASRTPSYPSGGFTAPLGLVNHLKRPEMKLDIVPVLDLIVIALLVSLLFTRFVVLPGVRVDLPTTDLRMQHSDSPVAVLTIGNKGMLYFDGSVYEESSIAEAFREHIEEVGEGQDPVLLVKAQAEIDLQLFLDLCHMAQTAGFVQVQIAGAKVEETLDLIPADALRESSNAFLPVM